MKLFNTLTRAKDEFTPIDAAAVRIYSCGPTVYNTPHIGNLRAYVFTDILKKTLEFAGYKIFDVMNLTDVGHLVGDADDGEDKVEKTARAQNTTPAAIAKKYTDQFFDYCAQLNIRKPKIVAPATEYIGDMKNFVTDLSARGLTYTTADGIYFDASKFPNYNKLSRQPIDKNVAGARVTMGEKKNANDFALWKFVKENALQKWQSPTAEGIIPPSGCPGWHIECSAIARRHLGDTFDIHTGGVDHIPIHHTNEIAQTESLTGKPMCNFWLHNEHIQIDGGKMSKSLGNTYTVDDLKSRGFSPLAYRYLCLCTHYRTQLNFTWEALTNAQTAYNKMLARLKIHAAAPNTPSPAIEKESQSAAAALLNDLNTPMAMGILWKLLKLPPNRLIYEKIKSFDAVLSLDL
jgi:cysteinyl-tRNA synthetase